MRQVVFPIAKNKVIGVTKISDDDYEGIKRFLNEKRPVDLYHWTLASDDYLVALDRYSNNLLEFDDVELFCFICY